VPSRVALTALLTLGAPRVVHAQAALEPVELSYRAPEGCPSLAELVTEVRRSTPRLRLAKSGDSPRQFAVLVEPSGRIGHLTVDGGAKGVRDVHGADCAEVSRLLAFAVALAADPDAQPPADSSVAAFPSASPARSAASNLPPNTPPEALPSKTPAAAPRASAPTPAGHALATRWSAAGFGLVNGNSAPASAWGGSAFAALELSSLPLDRSAPTQNRVAARLVQGLAAIGARRPFRARCR
jgi:hypothetical protein